MSDNAIEVRDLQKSIAVGFWGTKKSLLDGVSLTVARGATVGFVGPNGAGKSTTIKHLIGGARPTRGSVEVFGGDPRSPAVRRRFGYMPELPSLPPTLTPREMMNLHASLCGAGRDRVGALLERVDLAARARDRLGSFSKGMQTRLSLALALLHQPDLLILDEPMSGLDPVGRHLVREILREHAAAGRTIFFSSHVLSDVEALCDHVVAIRQGRVVYTGSAAQALGEEIDAWTVRVRMDKEPSGVREARREGDTWLAVVDGKDGLAAASSLKDQGGVVLSLEPRRASLEERLMELLGGGAS